MEGVPAVELAGRTELPVIGDAPYLLTLGGHAFFWFSLERPSTAEQDEREAAYQPPTIEVMGAWPSVLRGDDAAALEATLPDYLAVRRWFGGRGRAINAVTILDALPVGEDSTSMHVVIVRVEYAEGEPERYILPLAFASEERAAELRARAPQAVLATVRAHPRGEAVNGVLFDALAEPPCCRALLNAMLERRRIKGSAGDMVGGIERAIDDAGSVEPRVISQAHESAAIVYGDKFILKLFRRMDEGTSPTSRWAASSRSPRGARPWRRSWARWSTAPRATSRSRSRRCSGMSRTRSRPGSLRARRCRVTSRASSPGTATRRRRPGLWARCSIWPTRRCRRTWRG
jgi:maltose alpha-D-glucosyltransferase/alpha-amylase